MLAEQLPTAVSTRVPHKMQSLFLLRLSLQIPSAQVLQTLELSFNSIVTLPHHIICINSSIC